MPGQRNGFDPWAYSLRERERLDRQTFNRALRHPNSELDNLRWNLSKVSQIRVRPETDLGLWDVENRVRKELLPSVGIKRTAGVIEMQMRDQHRRDLLGVDTDRSKLLRKFAWVARDLGADPCID